MCVCVGGHVSYRPTYLEFRNNDSWGQDVLENNRSYELLDAWNPQQNVSIANEFTLTRITKVKTLWTSVGPVGAPRGRKTLFQPPEPASGAIWDVRIFDQFGSLFAPYTPRVPPVWPHVGPKIALICRFLAKMTEKSRFWWLETTSTRWKSSNFGCFIKIGRVTAAGGHFQGFLADFQLWHSQIWPNFTKFDQVQKIWGRKKTWPSWLGGVIF